MKHTAKKILALFVMIAMVLPVMFSYSDMTRTSVVKDTSQVLGTEGNPYTILEIVPDEAYAEIGYLIGGQEPTNLNGLIATGDITFDNIGTILDALNNAVKVVGNKEVSYTIIKDLDWVNYLDSEGQQNRETPEHPAIENVAGYYTNVGPGNGDWDAVLLEDLVSDGFMAKSWENDPEQEYGYVYITDVGYALIDIPNRTEYYRYDSENDEYISYTDDVEAGLDTTGFDYAFKTFLFEDERIYAMLNKISSETFRKVEGCGIIDRFTYVGDENGSWQFRPAFNSKKYTFDNATLSWKFYGNGQTDYTLTWMSVDNRNTDLGLHCNVSAYALADLGTEEIKEFRIENNEIFKSKILGIYKDELSSYNVAVVVKTPDELTLDDINNANIVYFNNGGSVTSYRYKTIVKLYKLCNGLSDSWSPSIESLAFEEPDYYSDDMNSLMSALYSRVTFGKNTISYTDGLVDVNESGKPVVIFDSSLYNDAKEYSETTYSSINKYSLNDTTRDAKNLVYTLNTPEKLYKNAITKLYIILNEMYPQVYFKHYLEDYISGGVINLKYINTINGYVGTQAVNVNGYHMEGLNNELLWPADIYGAYGSDETYALMGIDNPNLTQDFVVEHNVLSYNSDSYNNLIYIISNNVIGYSKTTNELFYTFGIDEDTKANAGQALEYLTTSQIINVINKAKLSILEIEPSNSFISETAWKWKISGLAPYYMGNLTEFNVQTTQMSTRQFIGVNVDVNNEYDLIYIGSDSGAMVTGTSVTAFMKDNYSIRMKAGETRIISPSSFLCIAPKNGTVLTTKAETNGASGNIKYSISSSNITIKANTVGKDTITGTLKLKISDTEEISKDFTIPVYIESEDTDKLSFTRTLDEFLYPDHEEEYEYEFHLGSIQTASTDEQLLEPGYYIIKNDGGTGGSRDYYLYNLYNNAALIDELKYNEGSIEKNEIWYYDGETLQNVGTEQYLVVLNGTSYYTYDRPDFNMYIKYSLSDGAWKIAYVTEWDTICGVAGHSHSSKPTLNAADHQGEYIACGDGGNGGWTPQVTYTWSDSAVCGKTEHVHDPKPDDSEANRANYNANLKSTPNGCWYIKRTGSFWNYKYSWEMSCTKPEHTHDVKPATAPTYSGQTTSPNGCWRAVETWDWVNSCTAGEHTHIESCYPHYYLYGNSTTSTSGTDNKYMASAKFDIYKVNYVVVTYYKPALHITKAFYTSDIATDYLEDGQKVHGFTFNYKDYVDYTGVNDVTLEIENNVGDADYVHDEEKGRLIVKSSGSENVSVFTLTFKYYMPGSSRQKESHMQIQLYECPDIDNTIYEIYKTLYNDPSMDGLLYSHVGDKYQVWNKLSEKVYYDGAIQRNGTSDYDAGLLNYEMSGSGNNAIIKLWTRFSGNDLTKIKMDDLNNYLDSDFPIVVSDKLLHITNGEITGVNNKLVDNSSYLYELLNTNKHRLIYESQMSADLWYKAFSKDIDITVVSEPTIYDQSDNGGVLTSSDYLQSRELQFKVRINTLLVNDTNNYGVRLFIDSNCDNIFEEAEELKNINVRADGTAISSERLKANDGRLYTMYRAIPEEYFGVINWKLEFYNIEDESIRKSIQGISVLNTAEEDKPDIIVLQFKPKPGFGKINLDLSSTKQRYGTGDNNENRFYNYMSNLKDFNIHVFSAMEGRLLSGGHVKDIFAYKVITKFYTSDTLAADTEVTGTLTPNSSTKFTITETTTNGGSTLVKDKNVIYTSGVTVISPEEAAAYPFNLNQYLADYHISTITGKLNGGTARTYYVYQYIQGVGFNDIYDYDNGADHKNESENDEVVGIDMLIMGFADLGYYSENEELLNACANHVKAGKTVLMTHDDVPYNCIQGKGSSSDGGGNYRYRYLLAFQDLAANNRYSHDTAWAPNSNREVIDTWATQGWTNSALMVTLQNQGEKHAEYTPFYKANANHNSDKLTNRTDQNEVDTDANSAKSLNGKMLTKMSHAEIVNRGQITNYPYYIPDIMDTYTTHHQYWQLDLEENVSVWLTLRMESLGYENFNRDTRNNYYIYSKENLVYTGMGHGYGITDDEIKLFVNTIVSSYRNDTVGTKLVINDNEASVYGSDTYIYIDSDYTDEDIDPDLSEMDNQKLKFNIIDNNLITNSRISIDISALKEDADIESVNLRTFDDLTEVILSSTIDNVDGNILIYQYTDNINEATLVTADDGLFTVKPELNYYLSIPEDIIEWAVQKTSSSDANSFTVYARMTLRYNTRLDSDDDHYTKEIQTLQRIIFIKRGLFMMD